MERLYQPVKLLKHVPVTKDVLIAKESFFNVTSFLANQKSLINDWSTYLEAWSLLAWRLPLPTVYIATKSRFCGQKYADDADKIH